MKKYIAKNYLKVALATTVLSASALGPIGMGSSVASAAKGDEIFESLKSGYPTEYQKMIDDGITDSQVSKLLDKAITNLNNNPNLTSDNFEQELINAVSNALLSDFDLAAKIASNLSKEEREQLKEGTLPSSLAPVGQVIKENVQLDEPKPAAPGGGGGGGGVLPAPGEVKKEDEEVTNEEQEVAQATEENTSADLNLTDIQGHWAEKYIIELVERGAIKGYSDQTFKPNNSITRAEFATILVKSLELEEKESKVFADTATHWAKDAIATAYAHGIVNGLSENTFAPNELITREQMAVMLVSALQLEGTSTTIEFADQEEIASWAVDALSVAAEYGLITGYADNTVKPRAQATRAEAATVIIRALEQHDN